MKKQTESDNVKYNELKWKQNVKKQMLGKLFQILLGKRRSLV